MLSGEIKDKHKPLRQEKEEQFENSLQQTAMVVLTLANPQLYAWKRLC